MEAAQTVLATRKLPIPERSVAEPEFLEPPQAKGFAYQALARVIEAYWSALLTWRQDHREVCGLTVPGTPGQPAVTKDGLTAELRNAPSAHNPGALSRALGVKVEAVTTAFARPPVAHRWMDELEGLPESTALAERLPFAPIAQLLVPGLNSGLARTFDLQAEVLDALANAARGPDQQVASAAVSILSSESELALSMSEIHRLLRYFSSCHFEHFRAVIGWMREEGPKGGTLNIGRLPGSSKIYFGFSQQGVDELLLRLHNIVPRDARHGCPASAARLPAGQGQPPRTVTEQGFAWVDEINTTFLFPLVAELYSRQAPKL